MTTSSLAVGTPDGFQLLAVPHAPFVEPENVFKLELNTLTLKLSSNAVCVAVVAPFQTNALVAN
jgi:hypothetical protein